MLESLVNEGYFYFRDLDAFQFLDINSVSWTSKGVIPLRLANMTNETIMSLNEMQRYLGEKYIQPVFGNHNLDYYEMVNGLDDSVYEWHHDSEAGKNKLGILMYFSNTDEETGGSLEIRNSETKVEKVALYPKFGDICVLHHTTKFEHRVSELKIPVPRIVAIFHYYYD